MTNKCQYIFVFREKQKAEVKDRKVLEILQVKDNKIQTLEQVSILYKLKMAEYCCSNFLEAVLNALCFLI